MLRDKHLVGAAESTFVQHNQCPPDSRSHERTYRVIIQPTAEHALQMRETPIGIMGLDITAYELATILPPHEFSEARWEDEDHEPTFVDRGMEQSFRGLEVGPEWQPFLDSTESMTDGPCVRVSGDSFGFRAGSYHQYGEFRAALAEIALDVDVHEIWQDPEIFRDRPFYELLNFSDCQGVIGSEAAADLANDFNSHHEVRADGRQWKVFRREFRRFRPSFHPRCASRHRHLQLILSAGRQDSSACAGMSGGNLCCGCVWAARSTTSNAWAMILERRPAVRLRVVPAAQHHGSTGGLFSSAVMMTCWRQVVVLGD
jgi:hypothetical protein